jgi:hypothetical protein
MLAPAASLMAAAPSGQGGGDQKDDECRLEDSGHGYRPIGARCAAWMVSTASRTVMKPSRRFCSVTARTFET